MTTPEICWTIETSTDTDGTYYRPFCETGDCTWSGESTVLEIEADQQIGDHVSSVHPTDDEDDTGRLCGCGARHAVHIDDDDRELSELTDALERAQRAEDAIDGDSDEDADRELTEALRQALSAALAVLRRDGYAVPSFGD